jgi:hypothetical protein
MGGAGWEEEGLKVHQRYKHIRMVWPVSSRLDAAYLRLPYYLRAKTTVKDIERYSDRRQNMQRRASRKANLAIWDLGA